jgi:hypothetical protein
MWPERVGEYQKDGSFLGENLRVERMGGKHEFELSDGN